MTRKEKNKFVRILKLLETAAPLLNEHYTDIFGTPEKPTWAPEDHVHLDEGTIIDIRFMRHGIFYGADNWVNKDGERVWCCFRFSAKPEFKWVKRHHKFEWTIPNACVNFDARKATETAIHNYLARISDKVLHYFVDNFNELNVECNICSVYNTDARRTFGLALGSSYFEKKEHLKEKHTAIFMRLEEKDGE